jgi:hypothetical protein
LPAYLGAAVPIQAQPRIQFVHKIAIFVDKLMLQTDFVHRFAIFVDKSIDQVGKHLEISDSK